MINPSTGNRIRMKTVDSETEEEISRSDTSKGYEYSKGRYVTITDEDLNAVRVESSTMMSIEKFVDAASIDPIYYDASHYLAPDGKGAEDVYAVVREAIARTGRVALTRIVIAQRERTVAVWRRTSFSTGSQPITRFAAGMSSMKGEGRAKLPR